MSAQTNKVLVERLLKEALSSRNYHLMDEFIAQDIKHHGTPDPVPGLEGFKESIKQMHSGFPDMKVNAQQMIAEGEHVATMGNWTGTHKGTFMGIPATGKEVTVGYIDWWKFENGKAVENWVQMDIPGMMAQLGLQPGAATAR